MASRDGSHHDYELAGWRRDGGDWHDVEAGDRMPRDDEWNEVEMITVNLQPDTKDGFYRSGHALGGFDAPPTFTFDHLDDNEDWTLDDMAAEMYSAYGFAPA